MLTLAEIKHQFYGHNGVMMTAELRALGISSRQLLQLVNEGVLEKIKQGAYQLSEQLLPEETLITKLFPNAIVYLESALSYYGYSDRLPATWQLAVDKNTSKSIFNIAYPPVKPFYLESNILAIGISLLEVANTEIRIYDRDRTICDVLRYFNKMDREIFNTAIQRYIKDNQHNVNRLLEYAEQLRVTNKVKNYIGVWL
ncbi:type IV toxin-antitoxin system AbiEi family antitoxin domain-containing protein [Paenibacillus alkaliterrae]|uniref:type IV toxin-antitoxin system AbiEi family antitoxin domain-containing protein n=1 Tax=Paenibacillus alkaliterrae TaxID=320909 RepID=UPI001F40C776|nr:type IV toxin-antitoxin system AbiEi family antitoxin domain-containing protein [Paenibacillus alkaliterrae]MCF2941759.1 type IV toxin-antitoxin system AbiEi family antitoxin domain-containing protein [Paenibacillus alkaliterrae]